MQLSVSWFFAYWMVYNHPRDAFFWYCVYSCQFFGRWSIGRSTIIQGIRVSCTGYAIVVSQLLAHWTVYNHLTDAFFLYYVCSCQFLGCWPIRRSAINQGMRFSCICVCNYQFLGHWPIGRPTIIQGMHVSRTKYAIVVSQLLAHRTVYNHLTDTFLLYCVRSCQFPGRWPIKQFTIIQGMHFSCTKYALISLPVIGLLDSLQSSKGCAPLVLDMQLSVRFTII